MNGSFKVHNIGPENLFHFVMGIMANFGYGRRVFKIPEK